MAACDSNHLEAPPSQLNILIDFVTHDDRPTFILDTNSQHISFRNAALDAHLEETDSHQQLQTWVQSLSVGAKSRVTGLIELGTFAQEEWVAKSVGRSLMTVFPRRKPSLAAQNTNNTSAVEANGIEPRSDSNGMDLDMPTLGQMRMEWLEPKDDPWMSFIRQYPFEKTALGPTANWPPQLRRAVQTMMTCPETRILYWGDELTMIYNEAAVPIVGTKHPSSLGMPLMEVWGQAVHDQVAESIKAVMRSGKAILVRNMMFVLERNGYPEQTWHNFHQLPITSSEGYYLGCVCEFSENTTGVVQENRATVIDNGIKTAATADNLSQLWPSVLGALGQTSVDVAAGLVFSVVSESDNTNSVDASVPSSQYTCEASFGLPDLVEGSAPSPSLAQKFKTLPELGELFIFRQNDGTLPHDLAWTIPEKGTINTICILPITDLNKRRLAFLVLGMNPQRPFDDGSRSFVESLGDLVKKSAVFVTLPAEQKRNEELNSELSHKLQVALLKAEKTEESYARLAKDAPIGMFKLRADGYPVFVNDTYLELLGVTRSRYYQDAETGHAWSNAVYEPDADLAKDIWLATIAGKKPVQAEVRVKAPTKSSPGRVRWLETISYAERDESDNVVAVQGWLIDIGPRKLTERLVAEKLQDALETKRATETFLDMLSHEMRNPLSSILQLADGILGLLSSPQTATSSTTIESLEDAAQTITLCAKHQKTIIDEVLTFSKLDSNLLVLSLEKAQIPTIIQTALKMFELELENAKIKASMNIEQSYNSLDLDYVLVDPSRLLQVIINFLTNSIKFTRDSKTRNITINVAASLTKPTEKDFGIAFLAPRKDPKVDGFVGSSPPVSPLETCSGEELYVYIGVEDSGRGLTEEESKALFQRFAQASPKTYKTYGGSGLGLFISRGLGLFISRGLSELQGGQIGVKSRAGKGSTFAFFIKTQRVSPPTLETRNNSVTSVEALTGVSVLPTKEGEPDVKILTKTNISEISTSVSIQDLNILLVEDNKINQKVISQQLLRLGISSVHLADHGLDALSFLTKTTFMDSNPHSTPLSLILLDVEMPIMDGLSCVRRIRQLETSGEIAGHVPVIAITANARSEQVAVALEAGMDEVVTKPFRIQELVPRMVALVQRWRGS